MSECCLRIRQDTRCSSLRRHYRLLARRFCGRSFTSKCEGEGARMIWLLTGVTFVATVGVVVALFYALSPGEVSIATRLARITGIGGPVPEEKFAERQKERVRETLANVGKLLPAPTTEKASRVQLLMMRAGYRSPEAVMAMRGVKIIFPILTLATMYFTRAY